MAIIREKYPEDKLVEEDIKDIQSEILQNVDGPNLENLYLSSELLSIFVIIKILATGSPLTSMEPNLETSLS